LLRVLDVSQEEELKDSIFYYEKGLENFAQKSKKKTFLLVVL
jgi:hypothetical protein